MLLLLVYKSSYTEVMCLLLNEMYLYLLNFLKLICDTYIFIVENEVKILGQK